MKQLLPLIGPETNGPSRLLDHPCPLSRSCKVVSGVCSMLGAARSADRRGGLCCGRHVAGQPGARLVSRTLYTSFGAVSETPAESPHGWNPTPSLGFRLKVAEYMSCK